MIVVQIFGCESWNPGSFAVGVIVGQGSWEYRPPAHPLHPDASHARSMIRSGEKRGTRHPRAITWVARRLSPPVFRN